MTDVFIINCRLTVQYLNWRTWLAMCKWRQPMPGDLIRLNRNLIRPA
jgi:hypothetical protein